MAILMAWGSYMFEMGTQAYEELSRKSGGRWKAHEIIGRAPAAQYLGPAEQIITLKGTIYPEYTGGNSAAQLRAMEQESIAGSVFSLVSGNGDVYGEFYLDNISVTETYPKADGTAQKITFEGEFKAYFDGNSAVFSSWP